MKQFSPIQLVFGGCMLAFGASFLNTGFMLSTGASVSHLTGDISRIGSGLSTFGRNNSYEVISVTVATFCFILGATITGFLLHHPTLEIKMPYGRILTSLGACLIVASLVYVKHPLLAIAIASVVCGVQNALASRFRGVVLRTTHLTGLFTDFGIHLGMMFRGHTIEGWKLMIPICITFAFLVGAVSSSALIYLNGPNWILLAGLGYVFGGVCWSVYKRTWASGFDDGSDEQDA